MASSPPPPPIVEITDHVLRATYDAGSFQRGLSYAEDGRVTVLSADQGRLRGVISGSQRNTYIAQVKWFSSHRGIVIEDECSCPLGGACKHCVALLLTARWDAAPVVPVANWRTKLASLVSEQQPSDDAAIPLALEVSLDLPRPSRWNPDPTARLHVRPNRMGKAKRWIKTGAAWRDLEYPTITPGQKVNEAQRVALQAFGASKSTMVSIETGQISLASIGPEFWFHLDRVIRSGVALVGAGGQESTVSVMPDAVHIEIDLARRIDDTVAVTSHVIVDDKPVVLDGRDAGLFGSPSHGLFAVRDGVLTLYRLAQPLHPEVARLVTSEPLVVPGSDLDELIEDYLPALARYATIDSEDGSVPMLTKTFTGLQLNISRTAIDQATFRWMARYRRGDKTFIYPVAGLEGSGRDVGAENAAIEQIAWPAQAKPVLVTLRGELRDGSVQGAQAITLLTDTAPWLAENVNVHVVITGDLPDLRQAVTDPLISLAVADAADHDAARTDWFDLSVQVSVDDEPIEFAVLFAALTRDDELLILPSGTWMRLDRPEFRRLHDLIIEARGLVDAPRDDTVRISDLQVSWWDELESLGVVSTQSSRWAHKVQALRSATAPARVEPSPRLAATLRPYQQDGIDWLTFMYRHGLGGILADDMGLGKTVQTLALSLHVLDEKPAARVLVVAPTSVVDNWRAEAARFTPDVAVVSIAATQARRGSTLIEAIGDASIVVTSYALFRLEFDAYAALDWELLLLDEAQNVKNYRGKTHSCVRKLDANVKFVITGTPLENSLMDLWALLSIVAPGLYPNPKRFEATFRKPIESGEAPELLATLRRRIAPLMRRRTKDAVLRDLPPKVEQTVEIELSARHARIYQAQLQRQRQRVLGLVGDMDQNRFEILKALTVLRQLSLDPALIDDAHDAVGSAKLDRLVEDVVQVTAEGHRALVFSQFTRFLQRVRDRFDAADIPHAYLDGRTRNRAAAIAQFTDGDVPVFVISLKAGGVGLNLTQADYCFVLDPWWNPAVETQAVDRAHRIGQRNTVMVYRYVAVGTIEEKVMELKARKAALFDQVVGADGALSGALSAEDVRGLFAADD